MRQQGFTLAEILVAVALLGALGSALVLDVAPASRGARLARTADELAEAVRWARLLAARTGEVHGVWASTAFQRVRLYRLDRSASPATPVWGVIDPIAKREWIYDFGADPALAGLTLQSAALNYQGVSGSVPYLEFDASGTPSYQDALGSVHMLTSAEIRLAEGALTRSVAVTPMSGKVSVQ
jgi:prepilin-type N-terminal cleavage/methylation domain-containing protein